MDSRTEHQKIPNPNPSSTPATERQGKLFYSNSLFLLNKFSVKNAEVEGEASGNSTKHFCRIFFLLWWHDGGWAGVGEARKLHVFQWAEASGLLAVDVSIFCPMLTLFFLRLSQRKIFLHSPRAHVIVKFVCVNKHGDGEQNNFSCRAGEARPLIDSQMPCKITRKKGGGQR